MKKFISYLLVAVLCLSCLAGCSKKPSGDEPATPTQAPVVTDAPKPTQEPVSDDSAEALAAAKDYLFAMYKDKQGVTASDYERVAVLNIGGTKFNVTWSANAGDDVKIIAGDKFTTIDINETTNKDVNYVLTATITDPEGHSITQEFTHSIPKYKETTWAEYAAAPKETTVIVTGVITGIIAKSNGNSSNALYFQDNDGGYYAYNLSKDPITELGLKEGMTIKVTGTKDIYSGTYEIINSKVDIVDSSIKAATPVDYTELFKKASGLKDATITEKQALLVTVKGVEITGQDASSGYYKFKLGDNESYIRISSSVCPIVKSKDQFIADHTEHMGWIANATGVICLYDGAFYLTPVTTDAFEYVSLPVKSDAEMVAFEAERLDFAKAYSVDTQIPVSSQGKSYKDVAIAWETNDNTNALITDDVLNLVIPSKGVDVVVTATLTAGEAKLVKSFTIRLEKASEMCTAEILAKAKELTSGQSLDGVQALRGKVTEIVTPYSEAYDNITVNMLVDGTTVQAYRLKGGKNIKKDDWITVTGTLKNFNGTIEFDKGCTFSPKLPVEDARQLILVDKAFELEKGAKMDGLQVLSGDIVKIVTPYSDAYDNITVDISVGDKTVQAFRLKGGADLKLGDKITVTGTLKNYNGTIEFDAGCTFTKGSNIRAAKSQIVVDKAYELLPGETMNGIQEVTGKIVKIPSAYNELYDNITVDLQVGDKIIQAYRLKGGKDLKPGDEIVVSGNITNYRGTIEFTQGCTFDPYADK